LVTVEDWDEEKFAEGVSIKKKKWARGRLGAREVKINPCYG